MLTSWKVWLKLLTMVILFTVNVLAVLSQKTIYKWDIELKASYRLMPAMMLT